jgi:hypothetical protein
MSDGITVQLLHESSDRMTAQFVAVADLNSRGRTAAHSIIALAPAAAEPFPARASGARRRLQRLPVAGKEERAQFGRLRHQH